MYSIALTIHIITALTLIALVLYTDILGASWMHGKKEILPQKRVLILHRTIWIGIAIMIVTGVTMFYPLKDYLLYTPAFYTKMAFLGALIVNSFFIERFMHIALTRPFTSLTKKERLPLLVSGAVSTLSWIGVIASALLLNV